MEPLGLELMSVWDPSIAGGVLTYYATALVFLNVFLNCVGVISVLPEVQIM